MILGVLARSLRSEAGERGGMYGGLWMGGLWTARSSGRDRDRFCSGCILGSSSSSSPGSSAMGELLPPDPRLERESVWETFCLCGGEPLGRLNVGSNTSETGVSVSEFPSVSSTELCESMEDRLAFRKRSSVVIPL